MSEIMRSPLTEYGVHRRHLQVVQHVAPFAVTTAPPASSPRTPTPRWADRLSSREVEVLECLAAGLSTAEIAQTLFISIATVKSHIARLIQKVEVRDRVQLVIAAYRTGFVRVS